MSKAAHKAPPCFPDNSTLLAWRNMSHEVKGRIPSGYCTDCLPDYQARMCAEGRCKFPETSFVLLPEIGLAGVRAKVAA